MTFIIQTEKSYALLSDISEDETEIFHQDPNGAEINTNLRHTRKLGVRRNCLSVQLGKLSR